jgi:hypothetical protein
MKNPFLLPFGRQWWCIPISGVVCWLYTMASLAVYTLISDMYEDQARNLPLYDLGRTALK